MPLEKARGEDPGALSRLSRANPGQVESAEADLLLTLQLTPHGRLSARNAQVCRGLPTQNFKFLGLESTRSAKNRGRSVEQSHQQGREPSPQRVQPGRS